MQNSNLNYQEIYQYLLNKGHGLSSENVLKQPHNNPHVIWNIFVSLAKMVQGSYVQNILAVLSHELEDQQKHTKSSVWLSEMIAIQQIFRKLKIQFKILDFFRPDKEKVFFLFNKVIPACMWADKMKGKNDSLLLKLNASKRQLEKGRSRVEQAKFQFEELTKRKKIQLPVYEEKTKNIEQIRQKLNEQRAYKVELMGNQKVLEDELYKKKKMLEDAKFKNQTLNFTIAQLKKEIAINAPQIKKEKRNAEEDMLKMSMRSTLEVKNLKDKNQLFSLGFSKKEKLESKLSRSEQAGRFISFICDTTNLFCQCQGKSMKVADLNSGLSKQCREGEDEFRKQMQERIGVQKKNQQGFAFTKTFRTQVSRLGVEILKVQTKLKNGIQKQFQLTQMQNSLQEKLTARIQQITLQINGLQTQIESWMTHSNGKLDSIFQQFHL